MYHTEISALQMKMLSLELRAEPGEEEGTSEATELEAQLQQIREKRLGAPPAAT